MNYFRRICNVNIMTKHTIIPGCFSTLQPLPFYNRSKNKPTTNTILTGIIIYSKQKQLLIHNVHRSIKSPLIMNASQSKRKQHAVHKLNTITLMPSRSRISAYIRPFNCDSHMYTQSFTVLHPSLHV